MWTVFTFVLVNLATYIFLLEGTAGGYIPPGPKFKCPTLAQIWPCRCLSSNDYGINLRCEDVSLAILSAGLSFVAYKQIPIEILHIRKLNAVALYGPLFENQNLTTLIIEDTQANSIISDFLYDLRETLMNFQLLNSNLTEYSNDAFGELKNLKSLTIDRHFISNLTVPFKGLHSLKALRISNGNISVLSKSTFAALGGLNRLDLHGNQLSDIPKDSLQQLKNLEFFDIAFNKFTKLDPSYFNHLTKLTWFNGSYNEIPEFKRGAFARNNFLRVIHLTNNKISKLDSTTLRGMRLLRRLYLSDNVISEVGRSTFDSINKVGTIDLSRNSLKVVDYQMFSSLVQAEIIDVSQNQITEVKKEAFKDLSYILINMSHNAISHFDKDSFVNCVNITVLDLRYNHIQNFSRGTFDEFSYPTELRLDFNRLTSLGDVPLKAFNGLKILNVSYNELEEIPKNTFPKLYELHTLDLSHNNISKIHPAIFTNLFSLRHLNLSFNNLTKIRGSTFGTIPTLIELKVKYNDISVMSPAAFTQLISLRHLDVSYNKIKTIFQISPSLSALDVSHNEITTLARAWPVMNSLLALNLNGNKLGGNLEEGSFSNLGTLQEIKLERNNLTEIPLDALKSLTIVQRIDLAGNSIRSLKKGAFGRLPVLFNLDLSHNVINSIEEKAFEGLLQLQDLNLSNNNITTLVVGCFNSLVSLKVMNLSHNSIERTENGTQCVFEENLSLEYLDVSHNRFAYIKPLTFPSKEWTPYRLATVDLSHNRLASVTKAFVHGTQTLRRLNLSSNQISDIQPYIIGNMSNLVSLDLSNNNIGYIDSNALGPPSKLEELNLQGNRLRKFPIEIIHKAPLLLINLTYNAIPTFDLQFGNKIKNGSRILLNDNPIPCDCRLIPLVRFFSEFRPTLSNYSEFFYKDYFNFECTLESGNAVTRLHTLQEEHLHCDDKDYLAPNIPSHSDLEIKNLEFRNNQIQIRWRVVTNLDLVSFRLTVEGLRGKTLWTRIYQYNVRSVQLNPIPGMTSICLQLTLGKSTSNGIKECQPILPLDLTSSEIIFENIGSVGGIDFQSHPNLNFFTLILCFYNLQHDF